MLFFWINTQFQSRMLTAFMNFITEGRHFIIPGVLMACYLIIILRWRAVWFLCVAAFFILLNDALCYQLIKPFFSRPRPCQVLEDAILYSRCSSNFSFPSNHASNIFTAATLISGVCKNAILLAYAIACLVGISRVYLGVHYPSDVLAGAAIGVFMGYLGLRIYKKINVAV